MVVIRRAGNKPRLRLQLYNYETGCTRSLSMNGWELEEVYNRLKVYCEAIASTETDNPIHITLTEKKEDE